MSEQSIKGTCLCGGVTYQVTGNLGVFQYCHCSRCRKVTGSAHASNLYVALEDFKWLNGEPLVATFVPEHTKYFCTAFCKQCGSNLPWLSKNGKTVIVPAGTLDEHPGIEPVQSIFCASKAPWYMAPSGLPEYDTLPPKKS